MSETMKEMMEFPVIYTFKVMGENSNEFINAVRDIFVCTDIQDFKEIKSSKGSYTSVSVTVQVNTFDELQNTYKQIKNIKGLKYHL